MEVNNSTCNWIFNFLTLPQQTVRVGNSTSKTIMMSTGTPQSCVLGSLIFSLLTYDCTARSQSNYIIKIVVDMTVIGLIKDNTESAYRTKFDSMV